MSEPTPDPLPEWSSEQDVYDTLGKLGPKVKDAADGGRFDTGAQLEAARAEAVTRLEVLYGVGGVPNPEEGAGFEVIRWAVARLAAANVLDILRASLPDVSELPERLRRTAWATLGDGIPGFPPGGGPDTPGRRTTPLGSAGGVSQFPDPYATLPLYSGGFYGGTYDGATNTWTF